MLKWNITRVILHICHVIDARYMILKSTKFDNIHQSQVFILSIKWDFLILILNVYSYKVAKNTWRILSASIRLKSFTKVATRLEKTTWQIKQKWFKDKSRERDITFGKSEEAESVISFTKDALNVNTNNF